MYRGTKFKEKRSKLRYEVLMCLLTKSYRSPEMAGDACYGESPRLDEGAHVEVKITARSVRTSSARWMCRVRPSLLGELGKESSVTENGVGQCDAPARRTLAITCVC